MPNRSGLDLQRRTVHISNIANVAYENCKILEQFGIPVELFCHDLTHVMSQPEWDDLDLQSDDFPDEYNFYNNTADFGSYRRPEWFYSGTLFDHLDEPQAFNEVPLRASFFRKMMRLLAKLTWWIIPIARRLPNPLLGMLKRTYYRIMAGVVNQSLVKEVGSPTHGGHNVEQLIIDRAEVSSSDLQLYAIHRNWMNRVSRNADVIFAYVLSPIYMLANHSKPFVAVEIGTMRDIPFDGTSTGKLLAEAYRQADYVLITNPDVHEQALKLGLERFEFCPHPIDEDRYRPLTGETRASMRRRLFSVDDETLILFAPARQNWDVKGNDRYFRAVRMCKDRQLRLKLVIPGWGQQVERSKAYCDELGISDLIEWIKPVSEGGLIKYFSSVDVVLDQFELGVFGLTTPKAMSCGAVVITSYSPGVNAWCFNDHPPLLGATTDEDIFSHLVRLYFNREELASLGKQSREWVLSEHSKERVKSVLMHAAAQACQHFAGRRIDVNFPADIRASLEEKA